TAKIEGARCRPRSRYHSPSLWTIVWRQEKRCTHCHLRYSLTISSVRRYSQSRDVSIRMYYFLPLISNFAPWEDTSPLRNWSFLGKAQSAQSPISGIAARKLSLNNQDVAARRRQLRKWPGKLKR